MKRFLLALLFMAGAACYAQDYKAQIATFREGYMNDFLSDPHSPLKKDDLPFLRFYNADSTYRVTATVTLLPNQTDFIMPAFTGSAGTYTRYAVLKFTLKGKPIQLTAYVSPKLADNPAYADYIFLPFTDGTNGTVTYGGGRYIDMRKGDFKNGTVVIDFNKAYNPYCAFAGGYSCPKPPDENKLDIAIEAGEKIYGKKH